MCYILLLHKNARVNVRAKREYTNYVKHMIHGVYVFESLFEDLVKNIGKRGCTGI